jgi:hypothetical protein
LDEPTYYREFIPESDSQWCPGGLTRSQKRRLQCLRCTEQLEIEVEAANIWCPKKKADELGTSANINMVFFLPAEYWSYPNEEDKEEASTHLILHPMQA